MNKQEAQELTSQIQTLLNDLDKLVLRAFDEKAWIPLGYDSWDTYCKNAFKSGYIRLPREERVKTVAALKSRGMSNVAIGSSLGVSEWTVRQDIKQGSRNLDPDLETPVMPARVTGTDGKSYPAKRDNLMPKAERNKVIDQNVKEFENEYLDRGEIPPKIEIPERQPTILDGDAITEEVARRDAIYTFREQIFVASEKLNEITEFGLLGIEDEVEWMKTAIDELSNMWLKAQSCLVETYQEKDEK